MGDEAGVVPLLCNSHPEMAAYIVVSPTPYFAETDASGNIRSKIFLTASTTWLPGMKGMKQQSKSVDVAGTGKADFALSN